MEKALVLREGAYSIWRHPGIPGEVLAFLDRIAWGHEGTVFEHKNTEAIMRQLHRPLLFTINENERIQGTAVFCNARVTAGPCSYNCYYIRYFAASREIKGKGIMKKYAAKVMEAVRDGEAGPTVYFAYVEKENKASYKTVHHAGYRPAGMIKTHGFSRFFPRKTELEQVTTAAGRAEVLRLLGRQYGAHALVRFHSLFLNDQYYVIREKGEIIAGCQYHHGHWAVNRLPGFMGKIIMRVVPHIPLLNKIFHPKRFRFLAFEGIYVKPGCETRLEELFGGLLAKEKRHAALYWMDENCPVRKRIGKGVKPGLLHSFVRDSDIFVMASFLHLAETEIADLKARPHYVSAFDCI